LFDLANQEVVHGKELDSSIEDKKRRDLKQKRRRIDEKKNLLHTDLLFHLEQ